MKNLKTNAMTQTAILAAVVLIMAFTPIGYLKTFGLEITFITIPVIIGAILIGPKAGAVLGCLFGLTSFFQCFGLSPFGAALLAINPFYTFIVCVVSRTLMGYLCGVVFKLLSRKNESAFVYGASSLCGALLNTLFFMSLLILFFGNSDYIRGFMGDMSVLRFVIAFVGLQGAIEAAVCFVIATAISKALARYIHK